MSYQIIEGTTPGDVAKRVSALTNVKLVGTMQSYASGNRMFYQAVASPDLISQAFDEIDAIKTAVSEINLANNMSIEDIGTKIDLMDSAIEALEALSKREPAVADNEASIPSGH
jgi:hypothetical protein